MEYSFVRRSIKVMYLKLGKQDNFDELIACLQWCSGFILFIFHLFN